MSIDEQIKGELLGKALKETKISKRSNRSLLLSDPLNRGTKHGKMRHSIAYTAWAEGTVTLGVLPANPRILIAQVGNIVPELGKDGASWRLLDIELTSEGLDGPQPWHGER